MTKTLKKRLLSFREKKRSGHVQSVKISGAGVASVDVEKFMKSRKISNVVGRINRAKLEKMNLTDQ